MTNTSKLLQATGLELDLENSGVNKTYATLQLSKSVDGVKHDWATNTQSKSIPQLLVMKKLKLNGSVMTYKNF